MTPAQDTNAIGWHMCLQALGAWIATFVACFTAVKVLT
jgi:hypothetical protein